MKEWTITVTFKGKLLEAKTHRFQAKIITMKYPNLANDIDFKSLCDIFVFCLYFSGIIINFIILIIFQIHGSAWKLEILHLWSPNPQSSQ